MERGQPTSKFKLRSPFALEHDILIQSGGVGYFNNIYAWLDGITGRTSISLLNLRTGRSDQVTTENREQLSEINISDKIIAAISIRGYFHDASCPSPLLHIPNGTLTGIAMSGISKP